MEKSWPPTKVTNFEEVQLPYDNAACIMKSGHRCWNCFKTVAELQDRLPRDAPDLADDDLCPVIVKAPLNPVEVWAAYLHLNVTPEIHRMQHIRRGRVHPDHDRLARRKARRKAYPSPPPTPLSDPDPEHLQVAKLLRRAPDLTEERRNCQFNEYERLQGRLERDREVRCFFVPRSKIDELRKSQRSPRQN
jgi:hypothetical protein